MKRRIFALLVIVLIQNLLFAQTMPPKREFRGVWLSTVCNIDWPISRNDSDIKKQDDLKNYLNHLKDCGVNAVFFQVRPSCDAMYKSQIEPWSYWFTGSQGTAPVVDWDPLEFAIEEAHKLGLELHAWVNPYRAVYAPTTTNTKDINYISHGHIANKHPEWLLKSSNVYILNPGLPQVRDYVLTVFMDIVNRYNIDGLHIDDYFYFYLTNEDSLTYTEYSRGINDIGDWRRDNVNMLIAAVSDSIHSVKPWVKWGVSPRAVWKAGVPEGIGGNGTYNTSFCDPIAWLQAGTVDYLTPQCYYSFGSYRDYGKLVTWWSNQAEENGRHCYPGQGMHHAGEWNEGEILKQVRFNRDTDNCEGSVFFTAHDFYDNPKHTIDSLKENYYFYPSLWPVMDWKVDQGPSPAVNFTYVVEENGSKTISWDDPSNGNPQDTVYDYILYRSPYPMEEVPDMSKLHAILLDREDEYIDTTQGSFYYALSTLDRNKMESDVRFSECPFVQLYYPFYNETLLPLNLSLRWNHSIGALNYQLILDDDSDFDNEPLLDITLSDTSKEVTLQYQKTYYWKIKANNQAQWSPLWHFTTVPAPQVKILKPSNYYEGSSLNPILSWRHFEDAVSYDLRISKDMEMTDIMVSENLLSDTMFQTSQLDYDSYYYWCLRSNKYDRWTDIMTFKTREEFIETIWERTALAQRYPVFLDSNLEATGLALGRYLDNDVLLLLQSYEDSVRINAINANTGDDIALKLNLSGVNSGIHILRDIEFSEDGVIYAANCAAVGGVFKVYQWIDPTAEPVVVYEADNVAYRLGDHITVEGRYDDGSVRLFAPAAMSDKMIKLEWDNVLVGFKATQLTLERGNNKNPGMAVVPGMDELFVTSNDYYIRHFTGNGANIAWMKDNTTMPKNANSIAAFAYNGKTYIAGYVMDTESAHIIDVTDGVSTALKAGATYRMGINENKLLLGDIEVLDNSDGTFTIYVLGNNNGLGAYIFDAASVMVDVSDINVPEKFELGQNYPNPFNPITTIPYYLSENSHIMIKIHDINGRLVSTIYDGYKLAGSFEVRFDANNLSSGIYICSLIAGELKVSRKLVLIK